MNLRKKNPIFLIAVVAFLLSACGGKKPVLEYGNDRWTITYVEACKKVHFSPNDEPGSMSFGGGDHAIVRVTFKCETNKPLVQVVAEKGGALTDAVYLLDEQGEKYISVAGGGGWTGHCNSNFLAFYAMQQDKKALTLNFYGVSIPLPDPVLTEDCTYR